MLDRYFGACCSEQEAATVLRWLATKEGQAYYDQYLKRKIAEEDRPPVLGIQLDPEQALENTYTRIRQRKVASRQKRWWGIAATFLLIVASTLAFMMLSSTLQVLETAYGERQELELSDGTKVVLNANSQLRYDSNNPREVWLVGEGYFDVSYTDKHHPFLVHTADLTVTVSGTVFNVQTRHDQTDVVLSEGRVVLDIDQHQVNEPVHMVPGDKVSFSQKTKTIEKSSVNPQTYTIWTKGTVLFDHTPLKDIALLLENNYGVVVQIEDQELLTKELSGQVELKLPVILTMLEKSFDLKIRREDNTITIDK